MEADLTVGGTVLCFGDTHGIHMCMCAVEAPRVPCRPPVQGWACNCCRLDTALLPNSSPIRADYVLIVLNLTHIIKVNTTSCASLGVCMSFSEVSPGRWAGSAVGRAQL